MEMKAIVAVQFVLNIFLVALFLRRQGSGRLFGPGKKKEAERERVAGEIRRWEAVSAELAETMRGRVREMGALAEELDRAEIRARRTLTEARKMETGWAANWETYAAALGWIREGIALEEVARRSGVGIGELRLIEGLAARGEIVAGPGQ
jgi:hypothetical protein